MTQDFYERQHRLNQQVIEREQAELHRKNADIFRASIPPTFTPYPLEKIGSDTGAPQELVRAKATAQKYIDDPTLFFILSGSVGAGKTTLALAVADKMIRAGHGATAVYTDFAGLLNSVSADYGRPPKKFMVADIVIIDDVGAGSARLTDSARRALMHIIDYRWAHGKYTIMTTNLPVVNMDGSCLSVSDMFAGPMWDRIGSSNTVVNVQGPSLRINTTALDRDRIPRNR